LCANCVQIKESIPALVRDLFTFSGKVRSFIIK
jgi:hypothetical protein